MTAQDHQANRKHISGKLKMRMQEDMWKRESQETDLPHPAKQTKPSLSPPSSQEPESRTKPRAPLMRVIETGPWGVKEVGTITAKEARKKMGSNR